MEAQFSFTQTLEELATALVNYKSSISKDGDQFGELDLLNDIQNKLFRILITNDEMTKESEAATDAIRKLYGGFVLPRTMLHSIALPRTSNDLSLLSDMKRSQIRGAKESFDRGFMSMNVVNDDIIELFKNRLGNELMAKKKNTFNKPTKHAFKKSRRRNTH